MKDNRLHYVILTQERQSFALCDTNTRKTIRLHYVILTQERQSFTLCDTNT